MEEKRVNVGRLTVHYTSIQCLYNMSYSVGINFATVFLLWWGFSNSMAGVTITLGNLLALLLQFPLASFADRTQKIPLNRMVALLALGTALAAVGLMIAPKVLPLVMGLYVVLICLITLQMPFNTALAMDYINNGVRLNFSLARGFGSLAFALAAFSVGILSRRFGGGVALPYVALVCALLVLLLFAFRTPAHTGARAEGQSGPAELLQFARTNKRFFVVIGGVALVLISHIFINIYTIQIVRAVGGDSGTVGIATAIAAAMELPAMALFPLLMRKLKNAAPVLKFASLAFVAKGLFTLFAGSIPAFYAAQCIQFFSYGLFLPSSIYYVNQVIATEDRAKGQSLMTMALSASSLLGSLLGGFLLDWTGGVRPMLGVGIGLSVLGVVVVLLSARGKAAKE